MRLMAFPKKTPETQGMGTVVRPSGPNGEVPRPLRSLRVFVETSPDTIAYTQSRVPQQACFGTMAKTE